MGLRWKRTISEEKSPSFDGTKMSQLKHCWCMCSCLWVCVNVCPCLWLLCICRCWCFFFVYLGVFCLGAPQFRPFLFPIKDWWVALGCTANPFISPNCFPCHRRIYFTCYWYISTTYFGGKSISDWFLLLINQWISRLYLPFFSPIDKDFSLGYS